MNMKKILYIFLFMLLFLILLNINSYASNVDYNTLPDWESLMEEKNVI